MPIVPVLSILTALAVSLTAGGGMLLGQGNLWSGWLLLAIGAGWLGILYGTLLRALAVLLEGVPDGKRDEA